MSSSTMVLGDGSMFVTNQVDNLIEIVSAYQDVTKPLGDSQAPTTLNTVCLVDVEILVHADSPHINGLSE